MKGYSTLPIEMKPHHRIQFSVILSEVLTLCKRYSQCMQRSAVRAVKRSSDTLQNRMTKYLSPDLDLSFLFNIRA